MAAEEAQKVGGAMAQRENASEGFETEWGGERKVISISTCNPLFAAWLPAAPAKAEVSLLHLLFEAGIDSRLL